MKTTLRETSLNEMDIEAGIIKAEGGRGKAERIG
jgi:hypothetical protein